MKITFLQDTQGSMPLEMLFSLLYHLWILLKMQRCKAGIPPWLAETIERSPKPWMLWPDGQGCWWHPNPVATSQGPCWRLRGTLGGPRERRGRCPKSPTQVTSPAHDSWRQHCPCSAYTGLTPNDNCWWVHWDFKSNCSHRALQTGSLFIFNEALCLFFSVPRLLARFLIICIKCGRRFVHRLVTQKTFGLGL